MNLALQIQLLFLLMSLMLGSGCVTKRLWDSNDLEAWNQPGTDPRLHVFQANPKNDLLIVYDEYSERSDATRTRAYWLNENQKLIDDRAMPHFVSTNSIDHLNALPTYSAPLDLPHLPPPFVITATNGQSFTLYSGGGASATHSLPFYNDGKGKAEKFVLTPLATAADVTIVGGVIGYLYLEGLAGSGGYNPSY